MGRQHHMFDKVSVGTQDGATEGVNVVVATAEDGSRHAAIMPKALARLGQEGTIMASEIQHTVLKIQDLQMKLEDMIEEARELGMSWNSVGWCVGTSGEAARQRWGLEERD